MQCCITSALRKKTRKCDFSPASRGLEPGFTVYLLGEEAEAQPRVGAKSGFWEF